MKLTLPDKATPERITALVATVMGVLVGVLTMKAGAGIGNVAGAALLSYVLTVGVIAWKVPLTLHRVVVATGKGALITVVVTVIVLSAIWRSFKGLA
ncbi:hypothetical protein ACFVZD_37090 [Streptomyces sp. NPDC058287]|uniref:hypothetical protein n=1 Tax=Streptomyces sp. NPDC058287 TaxID=3346423 RepID=UPI0036E42048